MSSSHYFREKPKKHKGFYKKYKGQSFRGICWFYFNRYVKSPAGFNHRRTPMEIKQDLSPIWKLVKDQPKTKEETKPSAYDLGLSVKSSLAPAHIEYTSINDGGTIFDQGGGTIHCPRC